MQCREFQQPSRWEDVAHSHLFVFDFGSQSVKYIEKLFDVPATGGHFSERLLVVDDSSPQNP